MNNNANKDLLYVYLLIGKDKLKVKTVLNKLKERMQEYGDMSFNSNIFNGQNCNSEEIINACLQVPFNSEKKYIIVNDADKLSADDKNKIVEYLENPCESSVLALAFEKLAKTTRLYKICEKINKLAIIDCSLPKRYDIQNTVFAIARKHQGQINPQAANMLVDLVGEDTSKLDSEIQKILINNSNKEITIEHVQNLVKKSSFAKPWDFTNAYGQRNLDKCLQLYHEMPKNSEFQLLFQICKLIKELICVKEFGARVDQFTLSQELKCEAWKIKNHIIYAKNFDKEELINILNDALDCDKQLKSSSNSQNIFEIFIAKTLSKN